MAFINSADLQALQPWAPVIAASIAAGVGAWVAHKFGRIQASIAMQQAETAAAAAKTAKNKLKLDLFDRRLAVYQAALDSISLALQKGDVSPEDEKAFLLGVHGSRWILSTEVFDYLQEDLWNSLTALRLSNEHLREMDQCEDRKSLAEARSIAFKKVWEQLKKIDGVFAPMLQLDH